MPNTHLTATGYLRDILDEPAALRDTLAALTDLRALRHFANRLIGGDLRRVVLTGMGSSYHALHPLALTLVARGFATQIVETSELVYHWPALLEPRTLIVAVSQSGRSAEIVHLLERARGHAPLIGVTNTADSPLATQLDAVVLTRAGSEYSVSCKTYLATLAALALLGDVLTGHDPNPTRVALHSVPDAVAQYLADWESYVDTLRARLADIRHLILAGRGSSLAAVGMGALTIKEAARFPAEGMSSAAFRHGPLEMVSPFVYLVVYSGTEPTIELNARLVADIQAAGGRATLVHESHIPDVFALPPVPAACLPLLEVLPSQMLSLALAQLQGHEPGHLERIAKVTTTE